MNFLLRWFTSAVTTLIVFYVATGIGVVSITAAVMLAVIVGLGNALVPYLIVVVGYERQLVSFAVFSLGLNVLLLHVFSSFSFGFASKSIQHLVLAAVMISALAWFASLAIDSKLIISKS